MYTNTILVRSAAHMRNIKTTTTTTTTSCGARRPHCFAAVCVAARSHLAGETGSHRPDRPVFHLCAYHFVFVVVVVVQPQLATSAVHTSQRCSHVLGNGDGVGGGVAACAPHAHTHTHTHVGNRIPDEQCPYACCIRSGAVGICAERAMLSTHVQTCYTHSVIRRCGTT